jgi:hypothetical protein
MHRLILVLCGWLLPLFALADVAPEIALRLTEGEYLPGDMLELEAEMRGADYAEFELHVPANAQCHFVEQIREPVRYIEGEYLQRVLLLLQPMSAGDFELNDITVTIAQGGVSRDVALPPVSFSVASYAVEDTSEAAAELGAGASLLAQASNNLRSIIAVLFIVLMVVWWLLRKVNTQPVKIAEIELGVSDLIVALEGNAPSFPPCEADESKRRSEADESKRRSDADERKQRSDADESKRRSDADERKRRSDADERKRRSDADESKRRSDADERKRRSDADERKRRSVSLHGGSELTSMMIAEQLLERADLSMSSALRQNLEAAVYANRLDSGVLLQLLREEVQR